MSSVASGLNSISPRLGLGLGLESECTTALIDGWRIGKLHVTSYSVGDIAVGSLVQQICF